MRQIAATKRDIGRGLDPVPRNGGRDVFRGGGNSGDDPSTCSDKYCDGQGGDGSTHEELRCPGPAPGRPANESGDVEPRRSLNPSTVRAFAGSHSTARCFGIRRTPGRHGIAPARGLCTMAGRRIGPQRRSAARRRLIEEWLPHPYRRGTTLRHRGPSRPARPCNSRTASAASTRGPSSPDSAITSAAMTVPRPGSAS